jgi:hypothetical protein
MRKLDILSTGSITITDHSIKIPYLVIYGCKVCVLCRFASEKVDLSPGEEFAARLLAYNIIDKQQKGWVLCPSSLVSTVLLQQNTIKKGL